MSPDPIRQRIFTWATASCVLLTVSLLLPGAFARGPGEAGLTPLLVFAVPFLVGAVAAVYVLHLTLGRLQSLPVTVAAAGVVPCVLFALAAALVFGG